MAISPEQVNTLIRERRSVFPEAYIDKPIPKHIIEEVLENANWAPTHRLTEPWRFKVFTGTSLRKLSDYLALWYKTHTPADKFSAIKYKKTQQKPLRSSCVIAICMQRDPEERVPEWEELAAVSCAVQNMQLSCAAYQIGCYWSSPQSILEARDFLKLEADEQCLGLLYMGYHNLPAFPGKRQPIAEKVEWIED